MRLPLKTKLFIGIAIAIVFVILLSSLSYYTSIKQREGEAMVSHTIQVRSKLRDISINLKDYTSSIRTLRRYDNAINLYSDLTPAAISKNVEELNVLVGDNKFQQTKLPELRKKLTTITNLWAGIDFQAARSNSLVEKEYYSQETKILFEINEIIKEMDNEEARLLKNRQVSTDRLLNFNNLANIGGTLLILTIVILLCIVINREFSQRVRAEKKLKENLDTLESVNLKTSNYNEVLNGAQSLIAACQRATNTDEFLKIALGEIAAFLKSPAAVVYIAEGDSEETLRATSYHGVAPQSITKIALSQLPVDISDKKQITAIAKNIPPDFWNIATTMGRAQPGALAYLFLNTPTHRIGIIEIGSFSDFTQLQLDYMNMIGPAIAVRLAAVQIEESRNGLLLQLQEKQEILINQQEELRLANDELTQQTHVLQASEEELRVQEEELKQINVELEEKNAAIESAREVLTLKAAELEVSGKYKSEFLANMSHELRTPLNSVLILASLLRGNKDQNLTSKQIEYSNIIHKSGSDLLKLINDILDLSKIESGKVDLVLETISISSLQENMRQLFFVLAEQNEINFEINIAEDAPKEIVSDRQKLEQVLKNLLSNAFKFTPKKGTISLNIRKDSSNAPNIIFDVKDTGIGIPQDKQAIVFEAFKQADGSTNRKYGGTGLGLSISRELAKILGGTISLNSQENKGSTFSIMLPLAIANNTQDKDISLPQATIATIAIPSSLNTSVARNMSGSDKTILIIEDDANFSSILQTFAEERQYKTLLAFNGKEGLEIAAAQRPDAIILDMQLPVMDGWEVLKRLKDDEQLKQIPVHVISASDDVQLPLQGAVAYLKKPVSKEALDEAFSLIGLKVQSQGKKLLILKGATLNGAFLDDFLKHIPQEIAVELADSFNEAILLGKEHSYGCVIADIGNDIDSGIASIENLKTALPFKDTSVIIFIDKEITQADERKLKKVSEAVVMNSKEVQRRLSDELELFLHKLTQTDKKIIAPPTAAAIETEILKGKKVLLADDDMRNVFALVSLLEEQGMEVTTAGNGREAVEALEDAWLPHIVLMDIMMPEMDGYEAMQIIRNRLQLRDLPMIAITAKAMAEDRELCLAAGASDYISKPVDTQKLLSLMRVWLSQ